MVPLPVFLPSNILAVLRSAMPYQHPRCSIPSHLSCIKRKLQRIALACCWRRSLLQWRVGCCPILGCINTRAVWKLASTEMFHLPPFTSIDPFSLKCKGEEKVKRQVNTSVQVTLISRELLWLACRKEDKTTNFRGYYTNLFYLFDFKGNLMTAWIILVGTFLSCKQQQGVMCLYYTEVVWRWSGGWLQYQAFDTADILNLICC